MPAVELSSDLTMFYEDDYFGEPWRSPETTLLVHGVAESSAAWYAWVPHLARRFRVLRPDNRGFGRSTPPAPDYPWSTKAFAADLAEFLDALGVRSVHVIGAKFGGSISMQFAADYPERAITLSVLSGPVRRQATAGGELDLKGANPTIAALGVEGWAAATMRARLGSQVSEEHITWWTKFMGAASTEVCLGVTKVAGGLDISDVLPQIKCPTLVVTTDRSALMPVESVLEWQRQIPNSELMVLPSDSYHIAAAQPDVCAQQVTAFIERHRNSGRM